MHYKKANLCLPDWILVFILLSSSIYNAQNTYARLVMMFLIFALPLLLYSKKDAFRLTSNARYISLVSILWVLYVAIWIAANMASINLNFEGPNVEMLTPVFFITAIYTIPVIQNYEPSRLAAIVYKFVQLYVVFLLFDMAWRYIAEPACFLNYNCRFEAKTVGYFSTTNALGTSLAVVVISLAASNLSIKKISWLFPLILLTSMARASIIASFVAYIILKLAHSSKKMRLLFFCIGFTIAVLMLVYDPFDLQNDGSALSKVQFFEASIELAKATEMHILLFGFGANFQSVTSILGVNDWSPHVPILKALLYFGVVGVVLHIYYLLSLIKLQQNMVYPVLAFFLLGLAGAPLYFPTFLTCFAILKSSIPKLGKR